MFYIFCRNGNDEEWAQKFGGCPESLVKTHLVSWMAAKRYRQMVMFECDATVVPSSLPSDFTREAIDEFAYEVARELEDLAKDSILEFRETAQKQGARRPPRRKKKRKKGRAQSMLPFPASSEGGTK